MAQPMSHSCHSELRKEARPLVLNSFSLAANVIQPYIRDYALKPYIHDRRWIVHTRVISLLSSITHPWCQRLSLDRYVTRHTTKSRAFARETSRPPMLYTSSSAPKIASPKSMSFHPAPSVLPPKPGVYCTQYTTAEEVAYPYMQRTPQLQLGEPRILQDYRSKDQRPTLLSLAKRESKSRCKHCSPETPC